jgi:hypothetical protein
MNRLRLLSFAAILLFYACNNSTDSDRSTIPNDAFRYFRAFVDNGQQRDYFIIRTQNANVLRMLDSLLAVPADQRNLHINGTIARGNDGYNYTWNWHFVDHQWALTEISIELCDAMPSYVEANLDYFIDELDGNFCPWGTEFDREMRPGEEIQ